MKYCGTYACGHEGVINIYGPTKEHERKREYVFSQICPECRKLERQQEIKEVNKKSAEAAVKMGLPALTGTEKQISWAMTIRNNQMESVKDQVKAREGYRVKISDERLITMEEWEKAFERIVESETTAKFWIENREEYQTNKRIKEKCKELYL